MTPTPPSPPPWLNEKESIVISKIQKESNQNVLVYVAKNGMTQYARSEAARMITNQTLLEEIAKGGDYIYGARWEAMQKLKNQSALWEIAKNDSNSTIRSYAAKCLTNQTYLIDILQNSDEHYVRIEAVDNLTQQSALADLAKNDADQGVRLRAINKLADPYILEAIATSDRDFTIRCYALKNIYMENKLRKDEVDDIVVNIVKASESSQKTLVSTLWMLNGFMTEKELERFGIEVWSGQMRQIDLREISWPRKLYYKGVLVDEVDG